MAVNILIATRRRYLAAAELRPKIEYFKERFGDLTNIKLVEFFESPIGFPADIVFIDTFDAGNTPLTAEEHQWIDTILRMRMRPGALWIGY